MRHHSSQPLYLGGQRQRLHLPEQVREQPAHRQLFGAPAQSQGQLAAVVAHRRLHQFRLTAAAPPLMEKLESAYRTLDAGRAD